MAPGSTRRFTPSSARWRPYSLHKFCVSMMGDPGIAGGILSGPSVSCKQFLNHAFKCTLPALAGNAPGVFHFDHSHRLEFCSAVRKPDDQSQQPLIVGDHLARENSVSGKI